MSRIRNAPALIAALALVALSGGCTTLKLNEEQSLENKSKAVAWVATSTILGKHPEWVPHFEVARDDLRIIMEAESVGLNEVLAIVHRLPVDELQGDEAVLIIGAVMIFFQDDLGTIALENPPLLRAVCRGLVSGITLGLPKP